MEMYRKWIEKVMDTAPREASAEAIFIARAILHSAAMIASAIDDSQPPRRGWFFQRKPKEPRDDI